MALVHADESWYEEWAGKLSDEERRFILKVLHNEIRVNDLTEEEKEGYREEYLQERACTHCGGFHLRACRRVRRLIMRNREEISEVEFWKDGDWNEDGIVWPEDVFEENLTTNLSKAVDKAYQESDDKSRRADQDTSGDASEGQEGT